MFNKTIYQVDNFLPESINKELFSIVSNEIVFPWRLLSSTSGDINHKYDGLRQFGLVHLLYDKNLKYSSEYFAPFLIMNNYIQSTFNLKIKELLRYRLGLNLKVSEETIIHSAHIDYDFNHLVFLYYLNDSDGATYFYTKDNSEPIHINPKKNTGVLFDGQILHSSSTPTKNSKRIVLNINFIPEEGNNE